MKLKLKLNQHTFQWIAIVLIAIACLFNYLTKPVYVSFDIKAVTNEFMTKVQNSNTDDIDKEIKAFNQALIKSLSDYEKENNAVIFVKGAVVTETADITPVIRISVKKALVELE